MHSLFSTVLDVWLSLVTSIYSFKYSNFLEQFTSGVNAVNTRIALFFLLLLLVLTVSSEDTEINGTWRADRIYLS